jgi:hypothetical protein
LLALCSLAALLFPALFLANASIRPLLASGDTRPERRAVELSSPAPLVFVVFDELPVASLMNERGEIDAVRFPGFGRLAARSSWYRLATTVSDMTTPSLVAMLTGRNPTRGGPAHAANHPDNLFSLLGDSHDLRVIETATRMCPASLCSGTQRAHGEREERAALLYSDALVVAGHVLAPRDWRAALPAIAHTWRGFGDGLGGRQRDAAASAPAKAARGVDPAGGIRPREGPGAVFSRFVESIEPGAAPAFYFVHVDLPHSPWRFLPSGQLYAGRSFAPGLGPGSVWTTDAWILAQAWQRHLLQVGYADALLAQLLDALAANALFEPSLIIVTADHGVSFRGGDSNRRPTATNYADLMAVPLLVKRPAQAQPEVWDAPVTTLDLVATIAEAFGAESLPWSTDGASFWRTVPDRSLLPLFSSVGPRLQQHSPEAIAAMRDDSVRRMATLFGSDREVASLLALAPDPELAALMGRSVAEFEELDPAGRVELTRVHAKDEADFVPVLLRGLFRASEPISAAAPIDFALSVDGTIVRLTRSTRAAPDGRRFLTLFPEALAELDTSRIDVHVVERSADAPPRLRPTSASDATR